MPPMAPIPDYVTRAEFEPFRADAHETRERLAVVESRQSDQSTTLNTILDEVRKSRSIRSMLIAGGAGFGGGLGAYLMHWMTQ